MRKIWSLVLIGCLMLNIMGVLPFGGLTAYGAGEYEFDVQTGTITKYIGAGGDVVIPDTIDSVRVRGIGNYAFSQCNQIASVLIPGGIEFIGDYAFGGCTSLSNVTIQFGLTKIGEGVFGDCTALVNITIPNSVTSIEWSSFRNCSSLTSINIPESITSIEGWAFFGCKNLESFIVQDANPNYSTQDGVLFNKDKTTLILCPEGKSGEYNIPTGVTCIKYNAFSNCEKLTKVLIPNGVTSIQASAFGACRNLTNVTIPASVTDISYGAFGGSINLTAIDVSDGNPIYSSDQGVLFNKTKTTLIICPQGKSGEYSIPNSVTKIDMDAFAFCSKLTNIIIPTNVTSINYFAFQNCTGLSSITIPSSITGIMSGTFAYCTGLTSINLPNSVTGISDYAFHNCTSLASVKIPSGVNFIGEKAFYRCSSLSAVCFEGAAPSVNSDAFREVAPDFQIYYLQNALGFSSPTWQGYPSQVYAPSQLITQLSLNDPTNLNQTFYGTPGAVEFIATPAPATDINLFTIEWYVNDVKQNTIGTTFSYQPTDMGSYIVTAKVSNNPTAITDCKTVTLIKDEAPLYQDFHYIDDGNTITISKYVGTEGAVKLPKTINNKPVTKIDERAFEYCDVLTDIIIPGRVERLEGSIFRMCRNLRTVTILSGVTEIGYGVFFHCEKLENINIPDSVTTIGSMAFIGCTSLTQISIPDSVTSIGSDAFGSCISLSNLILPANITSIGEGAFSECQSLDSISIPPSVTNIGDYAFADCANLSSVYFEGNAPSDFGKGVFRDVDSNFKIFYLPTATGFDVPAWEGIPSETYTPITALTLNTPSNLNQIYGHTTELLFTATPTSEGAVNPHTIEWYVNGQKQSTGSTFNFLPKDVGSYEVTAKAISVLDTKTIQVIEDPNPSSGFQYEDNGSSITITGFSGVGEDIEITIPSEINGKPVTGIAGYQVYFHNVTHINIPASITNIEITSFNNSYQLQSIEVDEANPNYSSDNGVLYNKDKTTLIRCPRNRQGEFVIPSIVTKIESCAFASCYYISGVTIPNTVNVIGDSAFANCKFTSIIIPGSVQTIEQGAFMGCKALSSITLENGIAEIGNKAFADTAITKIFIPASVTSFGNSVFGKNMVEFIGVDAANPNYCSDNGVLYSKDKTKLIQFPAGRGGAYVIPVGVTSIEEDAFANSSKVTAVTIPQGVASIGENAFSFCHSLSNINLPEGLTTIGNNAFWFTTLTQIEIPTSVTSIGVAAFDNCERLLGAYFKGNAPTIYKYAFSGTSDFKIYYLPTATGFTSPTWEGYPTATYTPTSAITLSSTNGVIGSTADITVGIDANSQMAAGSFVLDYDTAKLIPEGYVIGSAVEGTSAMVNLNYTDPTTGKKQIKVSWMGTQALNSGGDILRIQFRIAQWVLPQTNLPITLSNLILLDSETKPIACNIKQGSIFTVDYQLGDINGDGIVNIIDAHKILRYDAGFITMNDAEKLAADFNSDGVVDIFDAMKVQKYDMGIEGNGIAEIVKSSCSAYYDQTYDYLSYDGNPETLWTAEGNGQWVSYEFDGPETISSVYILFNKATERQAYFDLQYSSDGENYTTIRSFVADGISSGQVFTLEVPATAKYFRYYGKGNSVSMWNSIKEIEFRK